ncbi:Lsr2 family protein [Streptomyces mirabilis]|uniref:Lsr2 family DNA-binding protein n=1 Tax=Streptomyces mirabilis TaxID=68239 RepID=UPI00225A6F42|nr:Lsr2 family protein [Streptomyces mirabilis]
MGQNSTAQTGSGFNRRRQEAADRLEGVSSGDWRGPGKSARPRKLDPRPEDEPRRLWARTNGYLVSDRGRIPAAIRETYEASQR